MNFYAIGPLAAKEIFQDHPYHMCLAQYLYDEGYFDFMYDQVQRGHKVILDSGVYEGSAVDNRQLLYWIKRLHPWAVILPDKPHDCKETLKLSLKFAQQIDDFSWPSYTPDNLQRKPSKWKVLHADRLDDFIQSYIYDSRLFDGVCFSRLTLAYNLEKGFGTLTDNLDRPGFIKYLQQNDFWNPTTYHHALGMKYGSLNEAQALAKLGVNSIDSSAPIWRALNGSTVTWNPQPFQIPFNPFAQAFQQAKIDEAGERLAYTVDQCQSK